MALIHQLTCCWDARPEPEVLLLISAPCVIIS